MTSRPTGGHLLSGLVLGLSGFTIYWFAQLWQQTAVTEGIPTASVLWLALAGAAFGLHTLLAFVVWRRGLHLSGADLSAGAALGIFVPGLLARYVPGKVWSHATRLALAKRAGVSYLNTTGALAWEATLGLGAAAVIAFASFLIVDQGRALRLALPLLAATIVATTLLASAPYTRLVARLADSLRWSPPRWGAPDLARLAGWNLLAWCVFALAHVAVVRGVSPAGGTELITVAGAVAIAWAAGFLAVVMPLGLGVRDGFLLLLLGGALGHGTVLAMILWSRLLPLGIEIVVALGWLVAANRERTGGPAPSCAPATPRPPRADD